MSNPVRREEKRLQRVFHRALLIALSAPAAAPLACSAPGGTSTTSTGTSSSTSSSGAASSSSATSSSGAGGTAGTGGAASTGGAGGMGGGACAAYVFTPDPPDTCGNYVRLPCGLPADVMPAPDCFLYLSGCTRFCPGAFYECHATGASCTDAGAIVTDDAGGIDIDCSTCPGSVGRIPAGLARARLARAPSPLGDHFAAAAHLEAASVHAFRALRAELAAHRAPAPLLRAARRAQRDEVRHARVTSRLARRFGGAPVPPRVTPVATRPLDAVAVENAVEGCVRETFGALLASFQAANAGDAEIARAMAEIARDETRHAALSWAIARWAARRLDAGAREGLRARCREAIEALGREPGTDLSRELAARAGLPDAAQRRALLSALEAQLWGTLGGVRA